MYTDFPYQPSCSLESENHNLLELGYPGTKKYCECAFQNCCQTLWTSLSLHLRYITNLPVRLTYSKKPLCIIDLYRVIDLLCTLFYLYVYCNLWCPEFALM